MLAHSSLDLFPKPITLFLNQLLGDPDSLDDPILPDSDPNSQILPNPSSPPNSTNPISDPQSQNPDLQDTSLSPYNDPYSGYGLLQTIETVCLGTHIHKILTSPPQDLNKGSTDRQLPESNTSTRIRRYFRKNEEGALEIINDNIIRHDKIIISHKVKELGSAILLGKSIFDLGLPVKVFEPKSLLEKIAEEFLLAPIFLNPSASLSDPLQQF